MAPPPVLLAVVSWNTRDLLDRCLSALRADARAGMATVWVVDNASTDGSAEMVTARHPWARVLERAENLGFGRAVNLVAEHAEPGWSWLGCANADTAPEPGALGRLVQAGADDAAAGAVAPCLVLPDGSLQHSAHPFPTLPVTLAFNAGLHHLAPRWGDHLCLEGFWDPSRPRRVPWSLGAFLLIRREAWRTLGGFDEGQFLYAEDLDVGWRLRRAGWHTRHVPAARVRHESAAATSQAWGDGRTDRWQTATYAWMLRRRGPARTRAVAAINVAGAATRSRLARAGWRRDVERAWAARHREALSRALEGSDGDPSG